MAGARRARLAPARAGLAGRDQRRGRQRAFPLGFPNLRAAADEREPGTHLRGVPLVGFERVPNIACEICGLLLPGWTQKEGEPLLCPACWDRTYAFDRARSFAVYEDAVVRAILLLKFEQIELLGAGLRSGWPNW